MVTRSVRDLGELDGVEPPVRLLRVPAPLPCRWMGEGELRDAGSGRFHPVPRVRSVTRQFLTL